MLAGDLILKFALCMRFQRGDFDPSMIVTAEIFASLMLFGIIYLLASTLLPQISNRSIRKVNNNTDYHLMAVRVVAISVVYVGCSYLIQRFCSGYWYANTTDSNIFTFVIFAFGALLVWVYYVQINRYDRIKDEAERTLKALTTKRAPIVFLRSFELDKNVLRGYTFDEFICKNFSQQGQPIISLSDPDDFLPTGGSIKLQSFDDNWKEAIIILLKNCRAVVIFEGRSEGLSWEISKIKDYVTPDKLFVATPPKSYRESAWFRGQGRSQLKYSMNYVWSHFSDKLRSVGIDLRQKEDPGSDTIFAFDGQWHSVTPIRAKGIKFFDTILELTTQYETLTCDYVSLSEQLRQCELSRTLTFSENKKIQDGIRRIIYACIVVVVMIGLLIIII